jgi:hypothetical protein
MSCVKSKRPNAIDGNLEVDKNDGAPKLIGNLSTLPKNRTGITSTASTLRTLEADGKPQPEASNEPYHTLGVNLEGIAWLTEFHGEDLLDVIKQRRV